MKKTVYKILLIFSLLSASSTFAQEEFAENISAKIGFGNISSNSPNVSTLNFGIAYSHQFNLIPFPLKFEYQIHKRLEYFLPGHTHYQTYPYLQSFSVSSVISEQIAEKLFLNFNLGVVIIHDKVFEQSNSISEGVNVAASVGFKNKNIVYFSGVNYGFGFTQNNPNFSNYFLSIKYLL